MTESRTVWVLVLVVASLWAAACLASLALLYFIPQA
jgi:hypothetical protein